jgi:hypothetical protein
MNGQVRMHGWMSAGGCISARTVHTSVEIASQKAYARQQTIGELAHELEDTRNKYAAEVLGRSKALQQLREQQNSAQAIATAVRTSVTDFDCLTEEFMAQV